MAFVQKKYYSFSDLIKDLVKAGLTWTTKGNPYANGTVDYGYYGISSDVYDYPVYINFPDQKIPLSTAGGSAVQKGGMWYRGGYAFKILSPGEYYILTYNTEIDFLSICGNNISKLITGTLPLYIAPGGTVVNYTAKDAGSNMQEIAQAFFDNQITNKILNIPNMSTPEQMYDRQIRLTPVYINNEDMGLYSSGDIGLYFAIKGVCGEGIIFTDQNKVRYLGLGGNFCLKLDPAWDAKINSGD